MNGVNPLLVSTLGLLGIAVVMTALIYWFGARKIADQRGYSTAVEWTIGFACSICCFMGLAPLLVDYGVLAWILAIPFAGQAICLLAIQRTVLTTIPDVEDQSC